MRETAEPKPDTRPKTRHEAKLPGTPPVRVRVRVDYLGKRRSPHHAAEDLRVSKRGIIACDQSLINLGRALQPAHNTEFSQRSNSSTSFCRGGRGSRDGQNEDGRASSHCRRPRPRGQRQQEQRETHLDDTKAHLDDTTTKPKTGILVQ